MEDRILTVRQAAEILQTSYNTVLRWAKAGRIPAKKISSKAYRIVESELMESLRGTHRPEADK